MSARKAWVLAEIRKLDRELELCAPSVRGALRSVRFRLTAECLLHGWPIPKGGQA